MNEQAIWEPIVSSNSHLKLTSTANYQPPSFKNIKIGDLVKLKTHNKQYNFLINVLNEPNKTRVERFEKIPLVIKIGHEYEGIVLEKYSIVNKIGNYKEEIIKLLLEVEDNQYYVFINSSSCWYGGLIIFKFNGLS